MDAVSKMSSGLKPDVISHVTADKHVPMVKLHPRKGPLTDV